MDALISTFHIDWRLMLAQLVNFAIVVFVLWYFAFKPLSATMNERTKKIEKSLADAQAIAANLQNSKKQREDMLTQARQHAAEVIAQAKEITEQQRQATVAAAKKEVENIVAKGKTELVSQKEEMLQQIKTQAAELVIAATTTLLGKANTKDVDAKLVDAAVSAAQQDHKKK